MTNKDIVTRITEAVEKTVSQLSLGPTGKMPEQPLSPTDYGELKIGVTDINGHVIIHFGTPVVWVAFKPEDAEGIAKSLVEHAEQAKNFKEEEKQGS